MSAYGLPYLKTLLAVQETLPAFVSSFLSDTSTAPSVTFALNSHSICWHTLRVSLYLCGRILLSHSRRFDLSLHSTHFSMLHISPDVWILWLCWGPRYWRAYIQCIILSSVSQISAYIPLPFAIISQETSILDVYFCVAAIFIKTG